MLETLFNQDALLFTLPALAGTLVFALKLALMLVGGLGADADVDMDLDVDADVDLDGIVGADDSTDSFHALSIQSIAAFLMGFGWGGLGGVIGLDLDLVPSLLLGAGCGAAMFWLMGLLFRAIWSLQISGNINARDAVGRSGTVYVTVPARGGGSGQVRVVVKEHSRIYNAVSDGDALPSGARVQVMQVGSDHTLTVSAA